MENILVTGGNGFLGKYIVEKLVELGEKVVVIGRNYYPNLEKLGVKCVVGSITNKDSVKSAVNNCKAIFHVAALPGIWGRYEDFYNTNYIGTKNLIDIAIENGVKKFIYTSSPSVISSGKDLNGINETIKYPEKYNNFYPETKALAEKYVISMNGKNGILTCSLRPHLIWGPRDNHLIPRLIKKAKNRAIKIVGNGKNIVDTVYVENAADAHILAYQKIDKNSNIPGNIYFITNDEPVNLWEFLNKILTKLEIEPIKSKISFKTAYRIGYLLEIIYKTFHIYKEPKMTRFLAEELATNHYFDITKAKNDLGYKPKISLEQGLEKLVKYYKEQGLV